MSLEISALRASSIASALEAVAYGFGTKSKIKIPGFTEIEASFSAKDMLERYESLKKADKISDSLLGLTKKIRQGYIR